MNFINPGFLFAPFLIQFAVISHFFSHLNINANLRFSKTLGNSIFGWITTLYPNLYNRSWSDELIYSSNLIIEIDPVLGNKNDIDAKKGNLPSTFVEIFSQSLRLIAKHFGMGQKKPSLLNSICFNNH
ncbi:hypothetical protein [Pedobacter flavus]|uniref:Uncharacterized protein n=1 Tax=Pedobacter flavus TaxID=3113906 RepID=A0ABU7H3N3_9SPHI|nr:hypothetical protein [Pedobacter sp. VNH31]MEE1885942.1 hypothetical protein [Pedobacter sp. VNH31]